MTVEMVAEGWGCGCGAGGGRTRDPVERKSAGGLSLDHVSPSRTRRDGLPSAVKYRSSWMPYGSCCQPLSSPGMAPLFTRLNEDMQVELDVTRGESHMIGMSRPRLSP